MVRRKGNRGEIRTRERERELVVRVERLKLGAESVVEVYRRTCGYVFEAHVGSAFWEIKTDQV